MDNLSSKHVISEVPGVLRVFNDGSVERLSGSPLIPPSLDDLETGTSSKDITIAAPISLQARLYVPKIIDQTQKLPILVYFHGGGFRIESAFSVLYHHYINLLSSLAQSLVVSVEYRLAPEHPLPTAYEDCWIALNWVASQKTNAPTTDPWLMMHGDFDAVFIGGDSAGANIVHNVTMRVPKEALENEVKILGAFISHPYFLIKTKEDTGKGWEKCCKIWEYVYPNAPGGLNCPMINPLTEVAPSLAGLGCDRVLVLVAEKDEYELRDSGVKYYEAITESGYQGKVDLFEVKGEGHKFHVINPDTDKAKLMLQRLASFLCK